MIGKFGQLMLYVNDVAASADFWTTKLDFKKIDSMVMDGKTISVELLPYEDCDVNLVLFDKEFVKSTSPITEEYMGVPSLLFSSYDIKETHQKLRERGVQVSDISDMQGLINFNFCDNENRYFAIREISKN